jgi:YfiH family protein
VISRRSTGKSLRRISFASTHASPSSLTVSNGDLIAYQFEGLPAESKVRHAIFTRCGGASTGAYASLNLSRAVGDDPEAVAENNRRMLAAVGYRREQAATAWLVHGNDVAVITRDDLERDPPQVDAIVTRERGLPLILRFADCVPVVFFDPDTPAIGVAHAGWRGVTLNAAGATVRAMTDAFGSDPRRMWAGIGPAISVERYEVGPEIVEQVAAACPPGTRLAQPGDNGRPRLDLPMAVESQLQAAGVGANEAAGLCTASHTAEWFSHRAENGKTGRFGLLIALNA